MQKITVTQKEFELISNLRKAEGEREQHRIDEVMALYGIAPALRPATLRELLILILSSMRENDPRFVAAQQFIAYKTEPEQYTNKEIVT